MRNVTLNFFEEVFQMISKYDSRKKDMKSPYAKYYKLLTVPVTNVLSQKSLNSIIEDLSNKKVTFGLSKMYGGFCIWREPNPDEYPIRNSSEKTFPIPGEIIVTDQKELSERDFVKIWNKGRLVFEEKGS